MDVWQSNFYCAMGYAQSESERPRGGADCCGRSASKNDFQGADKRSSGGPLIYPKKYQISVLAKTYLEELNLLDATQEGLVSIDQRVKGQGLIILARAERAGLMIVERIEDMRTNGEMKVVNASYREQRLAGGTQSFESFMASYKRELMKSFCKELISRRGGF